MVSHIYATNASTKYQAIKVVVFLHCELQLIGPNVHCMYTDNSEQYVSNINVHKSQKIQPVLLVVDSNSPVQSTGLPCNSLYRLKNTFCDTKIRLQFSYSLVNLLLTKVTQKVNNLYI